MIENSNSKLKNSLIAETPDVHSKNILDRVVDVVMIPGENENGIVIIDPQNKKISEANEKAATILGYKISKLRGMNLDKFLTEKKILSRIVNYQSVERSDPCKVFLRHQNGSSICAELNYRSISRKHEIYKFITIRPTCQSMLSHLNSCHTKPTNGRTTKNSQTFSPEKDFPNIIGNSIKDKKIYTLIHQVAKTDSTVLLQGESGTGKELVAEAIHKHSMRKDEPFVKVNCAALSETLLESELFGHVKGSFTGAFRDYNGRFMQAEKGTILLDEIDCMSLSSQAKLLRVVQKRDFEPVGSSVTLRANVRIIVATNFDLKNAVSEGKFRQDLYYRLNVFPINLPPLRERKEDIPLLAKHFLNKNNVAMGKQIRDLKSETIGLMMQYDWPGNVRELENAIEHAVIVCSKSTIAPNHLPPTLTRNNTPTNAIFSTGMGLRDILNLCEKHIIQDALEKANGVKMRAAEILQIDPRNFPYLLKKHNL